ncbi:MULTISPECIES: PqqD family protein [unclassified Blastococcus]
MVTSGAAAPSFAFPETVLTREVSGELVLLDLAREHYYGLDRIAADIVGRLTRLPHDDALAELCRDYEVAPEVLRRDVQHLVDELLAAGLLRRTAP